MDAGGQWDDASAVSVHPSNRYEFTIDEAADFQVDCLKNTRAGASLRRREIRNLSIAFDGSVLGTFFFLSAVTYGPIELSDFIVGALIAVVLFPLSHLGLPRYYDRILRRRARRAVIDHFGGAGPYPCAIEVRPEGLWTRTKGVELQFAWSEATAVVDAPEGITVWFTGGGTLARARGFASPEERERFLCRIRELLPPGVAVTEAPRGGHA